ncbi:hypothetical protein AB6Q85_002330 [Vibrio cholerae]
MAEVLLVASIVSAAASVVSLAMTLSMKPDKPEDSGTAIDRKGQDNPKVVPFGRCLVPSVRVFNNVHDHETERLLQVHSFGVGKIKSVEQLYIDSVPVFSGNNQINPNHWYTNIGGEFPNLSFGVRLGEATEQVFPHIVQWSDGQWGSDCRGDRTAAMSLEVYRRINEGGDNNIRLMSDRFKLEALVHGNAVIDPRFDTSLQGASDWTKRTWVNSGKDSYRNPACVTLTYLLDDYYGLGLPVDAVDLKSFIDLANYCDQRGLFFDGFIDQSSDFGEILVGMSTAFDGVLYIEDGLVKAKADKESPVVCSIDMDDLVGTFKLTNMSDSSYYNIVNVEFINEETTFTKDKYVLPSNLAESETIKADGFEKAKDLKFSYTVAKPSDEVNSIKYLANKALKQSKNQRTIDFSIDNTKKSVHVYDVIEVTQPDYGLDKVKFRVEKVVSSLVKDTMVSNVVATEYNSSVYDNSGFEDGVVSPPIKPPTFSILSPTNVTFEQIGTGKALLKWENRHYREHRVVIVMNGKQVASISGNQYLFEGLEAGSYSFKLRAVDTLGSTSDWVELNNQTIVSGKPLPTVTGLKGSFTTKQAAFSWDDMKGSVIGVNGDMKVSHVFSHYEVIISENGKYHSTHLVSDNAFKHDATHRLVKAEVRVVDINGNRSPKGATTNLKNNQCSQPSGVKVDAVLSTVTIRWDAAQEDDYTASDVHISRDGDFTPSESNRVATSTSNNLVITDELEGLYFVKVGNYDCFGKDEMSYSPALQFTAETVDDLLDSSNKWEDVNNKFTLKVQEGNKVGGLIFGNDGETSTFDVVADKFRVSSKAGDQAVFQVDSATGKTIIKDALIGEIGANKITTGVMDASRISATSTLTVGSGNASAKMSGSDANWRIAAGNLSMGSAPFRVDRNGKLFASNADITGRVNATSGSFNNVNVGTANVTGALTVSDGGSCRTRLMAGSDTAHALDIYKGSAPQTVLRHNGQLQMWNQHGQEVINFNPAANTFEFKGRVFADEIIGDVVTASVITTQGGEFPLGDINGTPVVLYSFSVTNRGRVPAIVYVPSISSKFSYNRSSDTTLFKTDLEIDFSIGHVGNYFNSQRIIYSGSGNGLYEWQAAIPSLVYTLQAGQSASFFVTARRDRHSGLTKKLFLYDRTTLAHLFRTGSSFSKTSGELEQEYLRSLPNSNRNSEGVLLSA